MGRTARHDSRVFLASKYLKSRAFLCLSNSKRNAYCSLSTNNKAQSHVISQTCVRVCFTTKEILNLENRIFFVTVVSERKWRLARLL